MRLILDTHVLIWTLAGSRALPQRATDLLLDPANEQFVSVASLWEIAIKFALGRESPDNLPFGAAEARALADEAGLRLLPVTADDAVAVESLPRHRHADPFDRLLVAQAINEARTLLTRDAHLAAYGDAVLLV